MSHQMEQFTKAKDFVFTRDLIENFGTSPEEVMSGAFGDGTGVVRDLEKIEAFL